MSEVILIHKCVEIFTIFFKKNDRKDSHILNSISDFYFETKISKNIFLKLWHKIRRNKKNNFFFYQLMI